MTETWVWGHPVCLPRATELYFSLVPYHPADQQHGTTGEQVRHIDRFLAESEAGPADWGICTECGMGRAERSAIPRLLDLHHQILAAYCPLPRSVPANPGRPDRDEL